MNILFIVLCSGCFELALLFFQSLICCNLKMKTMWKVYIFFMLANVDQGILIMATYFDFFFFFLSLDVIVLQVLGASWYLLAFSRQIACWREICHLESPACQYQYLRCRSLGLSRNSWFQSSNITMLCNPNNNLYHYGIFAEAVNNRITSLPFLHKYFYCLWWGLKNLR